MQKNWSDIQQKGRFLVYFFNHILSRAGMEDCNGHSAHISDFQVLGEMKKNKDVITIYHCLSLKGKERFGGIDYFLEKNKLYFKPKDNYYSKRLLAEGVEKMEIWYGISCDQGEGICSYLRASQVNEWKKVKSVSLELHLTARALKKKWYIYVALPN